MSITTVAPARKAVEVCEMLVLHPRLTDDHRDQLIILLLREERHHIKSIGIALIRGLLMKADKVRLAALDERLLMMWTLIWMRTEPTIRHCEHLQTNIRKRPVSLQKCAAHHTGTENAPMACIYPQPDLLMSSSKSRQAAGQSRTWFDLD